MQLELGTFFVRDIRFGSATALADGVLTIDRDEIIAVLRRETGLSEIEVDLARPGESIRISNVLDVVEPRVKVSGPGRVFPGFLGPVTTVGEGRTHRLAKVGVVLAGAFPGPDPSYIAWPSLIDMAGPAAAYTPFSAWQNVVITVHVPGERSAPDLERPVRLAGLRAAAYLAEAARQQEPDTVERYELSAVDPDLPRVALVAQAIDIGPVRGTYLYGRSVAGMLPTLLHPNEYFDGAVVGPLLFLPMSRHATALYENHPIVKALYARHGVDLTFAGTILFRGFSFAFEDKERDAEYAVKLARILGAEAAIIAADGWGHNSVEVTQVIQKCERSDIRTVALMVESPDATGQGMSVIDLPPEAVAVVSTGNASQPLLLPSVDRIIGGPYDESRTNLFTMFAGVNQLGAGNVRAEDY